MTALADWLTLATEQLNLARERINTAGVTADDGEAIGEYLEALAEHGYHVAAVTLHAVENVGQDHPARDVPHGTDLQCALAHASDMFSAAIHFAFEIQQSANAMTAGDNK